MLEMVLEFMINFGGRKESVDISNLVQNRIFDKCRFMYSQYCSESSSYLLNQPARHRCLLKLYAKYQEISLADAIMVTHAIEGVIGELPIKYVNANGSESEWKHSQPNPDR